MDERTVRLGAACVFLWILAVPDVRTKRIPAGAVAAFAAVVLVLDLADPTDPGGYPVWAGIIPGAVFFILSLTLPGQIGEGDGICVMTCGLCTGAEETLGILEGALWMCAAAGITCILGRKANFRSAGNRIAFIPFLAASAALRLAWVLLAGGR